MEDQQIMDRLQEPQNVSPLNMSLKFGMIGGLVMIIASLVFYLFDMRDSLLINLLVMLIIIFISIYLAQVNHRDQELGGYMKYGRSFGVGMLTSLFIGILSAIFTIVLIKFVDPSITEQQLEVQRQAMIEQGLSDEEIEQGVKFYMMLFGSPIFMFFAGLFNALILGLIISLVSAAFTRK